MLHSFNITDGSFPHSTLIFDAAGNLYGTTIGGGIHYNGSVVELSPRQGGGWTEQVLHSFNANGTDGYYLYGGLIIDTAGNLYGTTNDGGTLGYGTVFELTPRQDGGWTEMVLHIFLGTGSDGVFPYDSLVLDAAGNLYRTTFEGGIHGYGTVFELTPGRGRDWSERVLQNSFGKNDSDGSLPYDGLIFDASGNLYGTTDFGGIHSGRDGV